jgi:hypothetical protein
LLEVCGPVYLQVLTPILLPTSSNCSWLLGLQGKEDSFIGPNRNLVRQLCLVWNAHRRLREDSSEKSLPVLFCRLNNLVGGKQLCGGLFVQGSTQGHWRFPHFALEQGYAYILTHPGTPCVFFDHLEDARLLNVIRRLIALRRRNGIHCRSQVLLYCYCGGG